MQEGLTYKFALVAVCLMAAVSSLYAQSPIPGDTTNSKSPIQLKAPEVVETEVVYDEETGRYVVKEKIGTENYTPPSELSFEEFWTDQNKQAEADYWKEKANEGKEQDAVTQEIVDKSLNNVFGSNFVEIKPQGAAELIFGVTSSKTENPLIRVDNQRVTNFDFDQKIQLNVTGIIGEKLKISTNYNTEASFDFENQIKLEYNGDEDEIVKKIEMGHVSLPLNTSLIKGSQSLFGVKSAMQFGKLKVTSIVSQQKSQTSSQEIQGGVQKQDIEITADNYDDNRHFYLAQYFYENYDQNMSELPLIPSDIQITRMEVWTTNIGVNANPDARNIIALLDLGESQTHDPALNVLTGVPYPQNNTNSLYGDMIGNPAYRSFSTASGQLISDKGYTSGLHFDKIENARKLGENEYTYHPQLGYISLNRRVEDNEVLAIAFEYTMLNDPKPKKVGEFSTDVEDIDQTLFLKLLKSTQVNNTKSPLWTLMMKNVYSTGKYGIDGATLDIDILYNNPATNNNINFLPSQQTRWLELLNMDQLDPQLNPNPDGRYDIIDGLTVRLQNGRIYFPVNEPFGAHMRNQIVDDAEKDQYAFDSLYTVPKWKAKNEFPDKNRYTIKVRFESKSSTIRLNAFNIPQGAVTVTAGGKTLVEGVDYRVEYNTAEVTILNQSILNSNTPIKIDVENNSLFSANNKTLFGTNLDYEVAKNFNVGATVMNLTERPLRQKTNQGSEPISNTVWGVNTKYSTESPYLTKLVDKLPFIETKEISKIDAAGEFAQLIPGSPNAIENNGEALSYIDDFEAGQINITIKDRASWMISSTPQGQPTGEWPEGDLHDSLPYGFNRAKIAWYNIDPIFTNNDANTPLHIANNTLVQDNHYQRTVLQNELFPNRSLQIGEPQSLLTFDVSYFPSDRGPYNFDTDPSNWSSGIDKTTGKLLDPTTRWGGLQRQVRNVDFETQNIEFIEFWVMSPFLNEDGDMDDIGATGNGGDVYFHLGSISEDVLKDGRKAFENGLPADGTDNSEIDVTNWGRVSNKLNLVTAFDNDPTTRENQDVGLDGLSNANEADFFSEYLDYFDGAVRAEMELDPAGDDYQYFRGDELDNDRANIIDRYKNFNGLDGNSPTQEQTGLDYVSTSSNLPDIEDVNRDNTLNEGEAYYEYKISMRPEDLENEDIGTNYLNQVFNTQVTTQGGLLKNVTWYQFRIPVREPDKVIGGIADFQSIRFLRMMLKGWDGPTVLRFGTMDFIQSRWRTYDDDLFDENDNVTSLASTTFNVGSVNLEEDSKKQPVRYVMPPNIQRQFNLATQSQENEQAMQLRVCDLNGGDARAMYKIQNFDLLSYDEVLLDVHAEQIGDMIQNLDDMNMSVFMRMGSDFNDNYYEYEVPLTFTDPAQVSSSNDESARLEIWKAENLMNFNYKDIFAGLKAERNGLGSSVSLTDRYSKLDGENTATVKGSPSLQQVKVIMIGVRNNNPAGQTRCAELWVNEMRLSGFDRTGGWATIANVNMNLADLGNIALGGGYSTPGWGAIDEKVSDRAREHTRTIDATGSFEMGKFLPDNARISVPMYLGYNQIKKTPQFNPLDTDIKMSDLPKKSDYRNHLDTIINDITTSKSINFSNVRKLPTPGKKRRVYSIENFDATYAVNRNDHQDVNTKVDLMKNYKGALNYNYKLRPKKIEPFKKTPLINKIEKGRMKRYKIEEKALKDSMNAVRKRDPKSKQVKTLRANIKELREEKQEYKRKMAKLKRSPYLRLYRDFNFYYLPKQISVQTDMNRMFSAHQVRNVTTDSLLIDSTFIKNWYFNRSYRYVHDLTRALKFDFSAQHRAFVDENPGAVDSKEDRQVIIDSLLAFGRPTFYTQNANLNWSIPINKFPWTSWITASAKYNGKYDWQAGPLSMVESTGHNISNNNTKQLSTQFNFVSLYNKSKYLKRLNRKRRRAARKGKPTAKKGDKKDEKKDKNGGGKAVLDATVRALMALRNVSVTYQENNGTFLPGYRRNTDILGMSMNTGWDPGLPFVFGSQTRSNWEKGFQKTEYWFSDATQYIIQRVSLTGKKTLNLRATVEPFKKFRIDFTAMRTNTTTNTYLYEHDWDNVLNESGFTRNSEMNTGSFSVSVMTFGTAFDGTTDGFSNTFKKMEENRLTIANRLAEAAYEKNPNNWVNKEEDANGFPKIYGNKQEEVLLYSFLSAYTGVDASRQDIQTNEYDENRSVVKSSVGTSIFNSIPKPNWSFNYNGLINIPFIKKHFKAITFSHRYRSTLSMSGYQNNLNYNRGFLNAGAQVDPLLALDEDGVAYPEYQYQAVDVSINEQFGPLGKIDMRFKKSNILANVEIRRSRTVGLNFGRNTVTEQKSYDFIVGGGYTFPGLVLPIKVKGKKLKSNLDLKANVAVKSTSLTLMEIDGDATTTQGSRIVNINFTGDYVVSKQITVRAFYNQTMNNPFIATSYPTSSTSGGVSIRFTL